MFFNGIGETPMLLLPRRKFFNRPFVDVMSLGDPRWYARSDLLHSPRMLLRALLSLLFVLVVGACDRDSGRPAVTTVPAAEPTFQLELKPLTPLLPNRPT